MEQQHLLFGDGDATGPAVRRSGRVRSHRPRPGERGLALSAPQVDLVDWALDGLARAEAMRGHALPVRLDEVLYLPRDLEVVDELMVRLDERLQTEVGQWLEGSPERARLEGWLRPAARLAQKLHEWWLETG